MQKTQVRHEGLIRQLAAEGHLTRREAKQAVRRLASKGEISFDGETLIVEVNASELRK